LERGEIKVRGLLAGESGEEFDCNLLPGEYYLVISSGGSVAGQFLDSLAGRRQDNRLRVEGVKVGGGERLPALPSVGLLPPAGQEIFVGTTVGEQLNFFSEENKSHQMEHSGLDRLFEFNFSSRMDNSVWELGAGERRCLLLVSQALAEPRFWVLHNPLDRMDGPRCGAIAEFFRVMRGRGSTLIATSRNPAELLGCCTRVLLLGDRGLNVEFYGSPDSAAEYLAELTGIASETLKKAAAADSG
jgi:ABC-type multidrug transport system ATPase subunit